ncbi:MAG: DUF1289 domain-containing protein [Alphaproteobacteria bacterium]|nr:DUF1289 domain-containing protein [Alphaproteobacteria bacterium]
MLTPCIKVCVIDPASRLCKGCGRTLDEIARWGGMSEAERARVMAELPERMAERTQACAAPSIT